MKNNIDTLVKDVEIGGIPHKRSMEILCDAMNEVRNSYQDAAIAYQESCEAQRADFNDNFAEVMGSIRQANEVLSSEKKYIELATLSGDSEAKRVHEQTAKEAAEAMEKLLDRAKILCESPHSGDDDLFNKAKKAEEEWRLTGLKVNAIAEEIVKNTNTHIKELEKICEQMQKGFWPGRPFPHGLSFSSLLTLHGPEVPVQAPPITEAETPEASTAPEAEHKEAAVCG